MYVCMYLFMYVHSYIHTTRLSDKEMRNKNINLNKISKFNITIHKYQTQH